MSVVEAKSNADADAHVDDEIRACVSVDKPQSFFLFAGAGSGKTRSLKNALERIEATDGRRLRLRGQSVGVITYTKAARDEIIRRVRANPLFAISTIHSFAWLLIQGFNEDIRRWLNAKLAQDIIDLEEAERRGRGGKASAKRQSEIAAKQQRLADLPQVKVFTYNPDKGKEGRDSLNHSEVIQICARFMTDKPLMARLVVNKYPILLIDECQDTNKELIDAFLAIESAHRDRFCLGLIGDTMQRIYNDGKSKIETAIPEHWAKPSKKLNFRCPRRVVRLINRVRSDVDDQTQEAVDWSAEGTVRFFVFPAVAANKPELEDAVRSRMAEITDDSAWRDREACKVLTLEHHMAARRMGFEHIFRPLYDADELQTDMLEGTLPATRFFTQLVLPLMLAQQRGDRFAVARVVREQSPLLSAKVLKVSGDPRGQIALANEAATKLNDLWTNGDPTCQAILEVVARYGLFDVPDALKPFEKSAYDPADEEAKNQLSEEMRAVGEFLRAPFSEILPYWRYVNDEAPYDTHQGVKGLEFERVMVVMDDSEAGGFMFGYDKLFGAKPKSDTDLKNEREGKETGLDRTRRLFYVTCSRAEKSLALIAYSENPQAIKDRLVRDGWFEENEVALGL